MRELYLIVVRLIVLRQSLRRERGAEHERADDGAHKKCLPLFGGCRGTLMFALNSTVHRSEF